MRDDEEKEILEEEMKKSRTRTNGNMDIRSNNMKKLILWKGDEKNTKKWKIIRNVKDNAEIYENILSTF